eukprot:1579202-Rhodomonas_salina.1
MHRFLALELAVLTTGVQVLAFGICSTSVLTLSARSRDSGTLRLSSCACRWGECSVRRGLVSSRSAPPFSERFVTAVFCM